MKVKVNSGLVSPRLRECESPVWVIPWCGSTVELEDEVSVWMWCVLESH